MSCNDESQDALEAEIIKGIQSGESTPMTPEDWEASRREVRRRHGEREQAGPAPPGA